MRKRRVWLGVVIALAFLAVYITGLVASITEKKRRALELTDEVAVAGYVRVYITVIKVDPAARQLTARLRFLPAGNLARDAVTPNVNLKLYLNNSPGQQAYEFNEKEGMVRIEATFALEGDINRYPLDRYDANLYIFMTTPNLSKRPKAPVPRAPVLQAPVPQSPVLQPPAPQSPETPQATPADATQPGDLEVGAAELQDNTPVPLSVYLSASTPGMKYTGEVIRSKDFNVTSVRLNLQRPRNLINVSILVMFMMMGLAFSVLAMVITSIASGGEFEVLPLSLAITLIFGLPALRNMQPNVPPVGVLGDYFSFIWAELFVAGAAIIVAVMWVHHSRRKARVEAGVLAGR